jgi:lipopolysaccharide/colanic/teichoic acid biosynthesis glycosyltransferase
LSLVEPRPMSVRELDLFNLGTSCNRFSIKPVIAFLWQVSSRSNLPFAKCLDLRSIVSWSPGLDIKILLRTMPTVLHGTEAV